MTPYDFVHLTMLAIDGEIKGKTKLQKTVYFLGLLTNQLDELGYRAHYYGPYSSEVADAVSTLEGVGFVTSNVAGCGSVDQQGFEVRRTDFRLTEEGKLVALTKATKNDGFFQQLQQAAATLKTAGERDYVKLSIAAKTFFMLNEKQAPATPVELEQLARRFGWNVSPEQIQDAAEYLKKLKVVTPVSV